MSYSPIRSPSHRHVVRARGERVHVLACPAGQTPTPFRPTTGTGCLKTDRSLCASVHLLDLSV